VKSTRVNSSNEIHFRFSLTCSFISFQWENWEFMILEMSSYIMMCVEKDQDWLSKHAERCPKDYIAIRSVAQSSVYPASYQHQRHLSNHPPKCPQLNGVTRHADQNFMHRGRQNENNQLRLNVGKAMSQCRGVNVPSQPMMDWKIPISPVNSKSGGVPNVGK
jgi:hypothetical protein